MEHRSRTGFSKRCGAPDNAVGKIDYHINDRHTLSGMYFFGNNSGTVDDAIELQPQWLTLIHTRAQADFGGELDLDSELSLGERSECSATTPPEPTSTQSADRRGFSPASLGIDAAGVTNPVYGVVCRASRSRASAAYSKHWVEFKVAQIPGPRSTLSVPGSMFPT